MKDIKEVKIDTQTTKENSRMHGIDYIMCRVELNILLEIADKYNLDDLNDSNWMQYEACMYQYQEGSIDFNTSNQIDKLVSFLICIKIMVMKTNILVRGQ